MGEGRSSCGGRVPLASLVAAAVALLIAAAGADTAGAAGRGIVEGTVSDAVTHAPIAGIEVCAYGLSEEAEEPVCAVTGAGGTYALRLEAGEHVVEFFSPFGSGLNYVTVYQGGAETWQAAKAGPITVTAGATVTGVNAAMHEGGRIEGQVTAAEDPGHGIVGIEVCALALSEEGFGCAVTGAGGDYEISALPGGEYRVRFAPEYESGLDWVPQFYADSPTREHAKPVSVSVATTAKGIDAALERGGEIAGSLTAAPAGEPLPGAEACALTSETSAAACASTNGKGEYVLRGLAPGSYAVGFSAPGYQWQYYPSGRTWKLAQQIAVGPGTGVGLWTTELLPLGYVKPPPVVPVPVPHTAPVPPPAPTPAPAAGVAGATARAPVIAVSSLRLRARHGHVSVSLTCTGAPCSGTLDVQTRVSYRARRHGHSVTLHRTVVLAQGAFALAAGAHANVSLRETAAGRTHLMHAAGAPIVARLLGSVSGGSALALSVHVS
ncbi:MAG TPA: carboxypeptidase-like regulatory domain-containing protein [Solirubrobacteraceae bacterium]|nr:carboxypeptidase-like regulatory domain-containing protein [Solirubrobacteraceae bacterium]